MIELRRSNERGGGDYGWLSTRHTFSFDQFIDPKWTHFRSLRVINEDVLAPGAGFPMHPHREIEIITYVLEGVLAHKDSEGNGSLIHASDVHRMSAGSGIRHSEANPSTKDAVRLLQIWIAPNRKGHGPQYEQKSFSMNDKLGRLRLIASTGGTDGSLSLHQDASLYLSSLSYGQEIDHDINPGRHAWLQVTRGTIELNSRPMHQGDGAAVSDEAKLAVRASEDSEFLLFDLA